MCHVLGRHDIASFDLLTDRGAIGHEGSGTSRTSRLLFKTPEVVPEEMVSTAPANVVFKGIKDMLGNCNQHDRGAT